MVCPLPELDDLLVSANDVKEVIVIFSNDEWSLVECDIGCYDDMYKNMFSPAMNIALRGKK